MSKCSKCQNDFIPLLKSDGLPYKHCDRCRCTDKKYRDKHKEQRKEYREVNKEYTKEYGIYYRELNKDMLKDKAKEYREVNTDKISTKLKLDRITCECGCTSRRDKISQHKKSSCPDWISVKEVPMTLCPYVKTHHRTPFRKDARPYAFT